MSEKNPFHLEGNDDSGYVGVDPEYQNYANETDKPILTAEDKKLIQLIEPDTEFVNEKKEPTALEAPEAPKAPAAPSK